MVPANAKAPMLAATGAMENVNVRYALVALRIAGIPGFNLMVLRVTATGCNLLVLLKRLNVMGRQRAPYMRRLDPATCKRVAHARVSKLAPKSSVNVSPLPTANVAP